jgi:hypothetical protein
VCKPAGKVIGNICQILNEFGLPELVGLPVGLLDPHMFTRLKFVTPPLKVVDVIPALI